VRRWVSGAVLAGLVLASAWLARQLAGGAEDLVGEGGVVDFYMTDFVTVAMGPGGIRERELQAERLVHYADSDTETLSAPRLCLALDEPNPWCVVAEAGWISADRETVRLSGAVHLWQQDWAGERTIDVYTRDVTVLTGPEHAHTEAPARIVGRWGEATGVGMVARLPERQLDLLSQVRTRYDTQSF
jgi:lipopolysaccharide export system protein LptC